MYHEIIVLAFSFVSVCTLASQIFSCESSLSHKTCLVLSVKVPLTFVQYQDFLALEINISQSLFPIT